MEKTLEANLDHTKQMRQRVSYLNWLQPASKFMLPAGVAYYNAEYGEYFLKIDEEPAEKRYYLKATNSSQGRTEYRMELVIKNKDGRFLKRQKVGEGYRDETTEGNVYIDYGSKYKTLVLVPAGEQ